MLGSRSCRLGTTTRIWQSSRFRTSSQLAVPVRAHTAIEINGGLEQLQELYATLQVGGVAVELTADRVLTKSFYVLDPDGNRSEFYAQLMPATEAKRYLHNARVADDVLRPLDLAAFAG